MATETRRPQRRNGKFTGMAVLLVAFLPAGVARIEARDNNASYPDFPYHGITIHCTASGNFELKGTEEEFCTVVGSAIRARRHHMCPEAPIDSLSVKGNVHVTFPGNLSEFDALKLWVTLSASDDVREPKIIDEYERYTEVAAPTFDWPFELSKSVTPGYRVDFQVQVYVCRKVDAANYACFHAITSGDNVNSILHPDSCFTVQGFTPGNNSQNVDFDQPDITVTFTRPADPKTVNKNTFRVYYWSANNVKTYVDGEVEMDDTDTVATFTPADLMDGVFFGVEVWGKKDAQSYGRPEWIKSAGQTDLEATTRWVFWTMPDLEGKVDIVPVQSVEDTDLIKGKPTAVKVFMRWDKKKNVDPKRQRSDLDANVIVHSVLQPDSGSPILAAASWEKQGSVTTPQGTMKPLWRPKFGTRIKRDFTPNPKDPSPYSKQQKYLAQDSVIYQGFDAADTGLVYFWAEVEPLGQDTSRRKARTFPSRFVERTILDTRGIMLT